MPDPVCSGVSVVQAVWTGCPHCQHSSPSHNLSTLSRMVGSSGSCESLSSLTRSEQGREEAGPAPVFTELLELTEWPDGVREWKEVARWVKYEETVEEAGNR